MKCQYISLRTIYSISELLITSLHYAHTFSPPPILIASTSASSILGLLNLPGISYHSYTAGPAGFCGAGTCAGDNTTPALNLIMGVRDGMMVEKALMMLILDMMMGGMILLQLI